MAWKWMIFNFSWPQIWEIQQVHIIHTGMVNLAAPKDAPTQFIIYSTTLMVQANHVIFHQWTENLNNENIYRSVLTPDSAKLMQIWMNIVKKIKIKRWYI